MSVLLHVRAGRFLYQFAVFFAIAYLSTESINCVMQAVNTTQYLTISIHYKEKQLLWNRNVKSQ